MTASRSQPVTATADAATSGSAPSAAHTPGPWSATLTIQAHDGFPAVWQIDAAMDAVCTTQFCAAPETEANARLIAVAPELLAELKWCLMGAGNLERMAAVIAKAEGRS